MDFQEQHIRDALRQSWSRETAVQWTVENPALGQCNVTAAVIFDLFGGKVLRTKLDDIWHYYNQIGGVRVDLTDSQFSAPGSLFNAPETYQDDVSSASEAMNGIPQREYVALKNALLSNLSSAS